MKKSFDIKLSEKWNSIHIDSKTVPEQFWDICRILATNDNKYLSPDQGAVSAISIGPFNIATNIDITQKDFLIFFAESIFPALVTETIDITFEEAYPLYFVPAFKILLYILEHSYFIQDSLQWKILIYIKNANENEEFPTISDIISEFIKFNDEDSIKESIFNLLHAKSTFGTQGSIISLDENECLHSLA